jgi:MFS family permease
MSPYAIKSFRRQWASDLSTSCGFEIEAPALAWYVLSETGSVVFMAGITSLQYAGTLLAPFVGAAGDRYGPKKIMLAMRLLYAVVAMAILLLAASGLLTPWLALVLAAVSGLVRSSDVGMRNVLTSIIVPRDLLMGAMGLSRITVDLSRAAGAIVGTAIMATMGIAWAYAAVVCFYASAVFFTASLQLDDASRSAPAARTAAFGQVWQAVQSVRAAPAQAATLLLAFLVNLTAFPFMMGLLPYVAKDRFGMDQFGLGLLIATVSAGSIASAVVLIRIRIGQPAVTMLVFSIVWYALIIAFGLAPTMPLAFAALFLAGMAQGLAMVPMAVFLLSNISPALRGSIIGLRSMAVYGLPVGLMLTGAALNKGVAFEWVAAVCGGLGIAATILLWWRNRAHFGGPQLYRKSID